MKRLLVVVLLLAGCGGAEGGSTDGLVLGETAVPAAVAPVPTKYHPTEPPDVVFDLPVKLTKRTASVARNARASVTIKTTKGAECGIDVQYKSGSSTAGGLEPKVANAKGAIPGSGSSRRMPALGKRPS